MVRVRASGDATAGTLDLLEHQGERGYGSPLHRHLAEEETFFVLDGEVRVEVCGEAHTPGGFDRFTVDVGTPAAGTTMPPEEAPPHPAALAAMASSYGIEILGPPPAP